MPATFTLCLGVNNVRYTGGPTAPRRAVVRKHKSGVVRTHTVAAAGQQTTGDVAQILEEKYNILETFSREYEDEIAAALANSMANAIQDLVDGLPSEGNPFAGAEDEIEKSMKLFLDLHGMDGSGPVPTKAAERGINHSLAHPYSKSNPPRPSFVDTGTMRSNYRAWTEES